MNSFIKNVFTMILAITVSALLYFILFGTQRTLDGTAMTENNTTSPTFTINVGWKGALYYAAEAVEYSMARYYYEYCYLPNVHCNDGLDISLGLKLTNPNMQLTDSYLGNKYSSDYTKIKYKSPDYENIISGGYYDTGWY